MEELDKIAGLRQQIDRIDDELIRLLRERLQVAREIGRIKQRSDIPVVDAQRESDLSDRLDALAGSDLLTRAFVRRLWQLILIESYRVQREDPT